MKETLRIRDVYREYELGKIQFEEVIAASERIIAAWETGGAVKTPR